MGGVQHPLYQRPDAYAAVGGRGVLLGRPVGDAQRPRSRGDRPPRFGRPGPSQAHGFSAATCCGGYDDRDRGTHATRAAARR